ncbi:MAG: ester cyclase [Caldilineaceae bacterium]
MSTEQNKAIMRRIPEEAFGQGNLAVVDEVFAPDYIPHVQRRVPNGANGTAAVKQFIGMVRSAFPDVRYTVEDAIAEGDKVVMRVNISGTHQGDFMGVPATGKEVGWTEMHIARMADGKLVEHWFSSDQLALLQQLGALPARG